MRLIWHSDGRPARDATEEVLRDLYAFGDAPLLRANFVSTLDGAGTGEDGLTDSINTGADNRVFSLQRTLCDAILVGAGTARAEGYRRAARVDGHAPTTVAVSNHAQVPGALAQPDAERGDALLVTCEAAGATAIRTAEEALGREWVWVVGRSEVDLPALVARLVEAGLPRLLCEGGPTFFSSLLAAGQVDEVALTFVPTLVGGDLTRITHGAPLDVALGARHLLEEDGTVLGLWRVLDPPAGHSTSR